MHWLLPQLLQQFALLSVPLHLISREGSIPEVSFQRYLMEHAL